MSATSTATKNTATADDERAPGAPDPTNRPRTEKRSRARVADLAAELYATKRPYLLGIARSHALNPEDAEESLQEAFIAFVEHYDPAGEAPALAWLTLTLKRECWGRRRREHLDRRAGQEARPGTEELGARLDQVGDELPSPHEHAERRERIAEARDQIALLKPDERRALTLKALGFSSKEIGEQTGWTHTKINRCIAEGRARLRELAAA